MAIVYTSATMPDIQVSYTANSKSMLDVIEKVLVDGWDDIPVESASVTDNTLTVVSPDAIPKHLGWYSVCDMRLRNSQLDGLWACVGVNESTATFIPIDRQVADYTGSASGVIAKVSAGWTRLHKSADFLVLRPKAETKRCFLFKQNLGSGIISSLNRNYSATTKTANNAAINNEFCQCVPLHDWNDALTPIENFNAHAIPIRQHINGINTPAHTMPPFFQIKSYSNSRQWYIIATDKYCYFGQKQNIHYNNGGFGISKNVYGQDCLWIAGAAYIDSATPTQNIGNTQIRAYNIAAPATHNNVTNPPIIVQDPTGNSMLGRFVTVTQRLSHSQEYEFGYEYNFIDTTAEPVMLRLEYDRSNSFYSMVPYFQMPGAYSYYGNLKTDISYESINNEQFIVFRSYSNQYPSSSFYNYVGLKL